MPHKNESMNKIGDMVNKIKVAMMMTENENGDFHSRPMATQEYYLDGNLWFFAERDSEVVQDILRNPRVNLAYADGANYLSIAGEAKITSDVQQKKDFWQDSLKLWFDDGPESPNLILIHVQGKSAQYWDGPSSLIGKAVSMVKVLLTGDGEAAGDSEQIKFQA